MKTEFTVAVAYILEAVKVLRKGPLLIQIVLNWNVKDNEIIAKGVFTK